MNNLIDKLCIREQQQLFMYDWDYVSDILSQPGGFATLTGRFIVQFFHSQMSAITICLLLALTLGAVLWGTGCKVSGKRAWWIPVLCLAPGTLMLMSLSDINLHFENCISILIAAAVVFIHASISFRSKGRMSAAAIAGTVTTWYLAGPTAIIYAVCALIIDLRRKGGIGALLYPLFAVIIGTITFITGHTGQFWQALSPAYFYEVTSAMPLVHLASWLAVPAVIGITTFCQKSIPGWIISCVALAAAVIVFVSYTDRKELRYETECNRMELLTAQEKWQELSDFSRRHLTNYKAANYYNLAQAQMGTLAENLFKVPQNGPMSLIHISSEHAADICLAHVLYACGNIAGAQNIAFNALQTRCGYNPTLLMMLTKIEIMRGSYEVAEKYINILSKAPHYKSWAERYTAFLWNDELVEGDCELSTGRRDLPKTEGFVNDRSPMEELLKIIEANPSDAKAMEYALSFLLLAKDFNYIYTFTNKYYGTEGLKSLPTPVQEALIFFSDYYNTQTEEYALSHGLTKEEFDEYRQIDIDWCKEHGVEDSTIRRFAAFKEAYGRNRGGNAPSGYSDTWWHYMLYTKI